MKLLNYLAGLALLASFSCKPYRTAQITVSDIDINLQKNWISDYVTIKTEEGKNFYMMDARELISGADTLMVGDSAEVKYEKRFGKNIVRCFQE